MGQGESRAANAEAGTRGRVSAPSTGFHVLRVASGSPAAVAGIEPFFDYIIGIDGREVGDGRARTLTQPRDGDALASTISAAENSTVTLTIFSARRQLVREVIVSPQRAWTGAHRDDASLLGLSLRRCAPARALDNVSGPSTGLTAGMARSRHRRRQPSSGRGPGPAR